MLSPIHLSPTVTIDPVALAPMSAVTDAPLRGLVRSLGGGYLVSEMIVSRDTIAFEKNSARKSHGASDALQLAGSDPKLMAEAARISESKGARIIDINFGCPAKKVVNCYCGAFMMRDEVLAGQIVSAVVQAVSVPVTVKMRLGWDSDSLNAPALAKIFEGEGAKMLSIHGRTRAQFYSGKANWHSVRDVKMATALPVLVNGDINTYDDALEALAQSGADGVMVGRASYGRPWAISNMLEFLRSGERRPEPGAAERGVLMMHHLDSIVEFYGPQCGLGLAKKHAAWYSKGLSNSAEFRASLGVVDSIEKLFGLLGEFFSCER